MNHAFLINEIMLENIGKNTSGGFDLEERMDMWKSTSSVGVN